MKITASNLVRILDQALPHTAPDTTYAPALNAIHLDYDGTYLHAAATDRYTFVVARAETVTDVPDEKAATPWTATPWARTLPLTAVKALRKIMRRKEPNHLYTITPGTTGDANTLTFASDTANLTFHTVPHTFPAWRPLMAGVLAKEPTDDIVGMDTAYTARWEGAERYLRNWATGPSSPIVFAGHNFLGLQMPVRREEEHSREAVTKHWAASLGNAPAADAAEVLGQAQTAKPHREFTEDLLRRVVIGGEELSNGTGGPDDPRWYDVLNTTIYAWIGVRLLRALTSAAPGLAEEALRDLDEELEGGEFGEWAWQYATEAGHDPDKWAEDHAKWRADRAAKQADQELPTTAAADNAPAEPAELAELAEAPAAT